MPISLLKLLLGALEFCGDGEDVEGEKEWLWILSCL